MTHPTKAIMYTLLKDFVRMAAGSSDEQVRPKCWEFKGSKLCT